MSERTGFLRENDEEKIQNPRVKMRKYFPFILNTCFSLILLLVNISWFNFISPFGSPRKMIELAILLGLSMTITICAVLLCKGGCRYLFGLIFGIIAQAIFVAVKNESVYSKIDFDTVLYILLHNVFLFSLFFTSIVESMRISRNLFAKKGHEFSA